MILGSEGRLGIITEATMQVRPLAEQRTILGYLFPRFADGLAAMQEIAHSECSVSVTRVSDAAETQFSFAMRKPPTPLERAQSAALQLYLKRRLGWDVGQMCLSFIGYEGSRRHVAAQRHAVGQIVKRHGGLCIGSGPGALYDQKKFDTPYIRDFLLDRGGAGDVSETAMPWSRLSPVYDAVSTAAQGAFRSLGVQGYLMCHLSHSYHTGACLYFTFAFRSGPGRTCSSSTTSSSRRSSSRSSTTARRCLTTTRSGPSTPRGWSRTSPNPAPRCSEPCSTAPTPTTASTPARSSEPRYAYMRTSASATIAGRSEPSTSIVTRTFSCTPPWISGTSTAPRRRASGPRPAAAPESERGPGRS